MRRLELCWRVRKDLRSSERNQGKEFCLDFFPRMSDVAPLCLCSVYLELTDLIAISRLLVITEGMGAGHGPP